LADDPHAHASFAPAPAQLGLQLGARRYIGCSGFFELLCKLAEPALPLRAEAAKSDFLHPVCDSSHQQFAGEVWRCLGFVENAPLLFPTPEPLR
jgi:hypothetical protein